MEESNQSSVSPEATALLKERNFISILIDLYKNRPVLWNTKHKRYNDRLHRGELLDEIVKELQTYKPDFDTEKLKKKINIIRTCFNKERHRLQQKRAQGYDAKPALWYFNQMLFLGELEPQRSANTSNSAIDSADNQDSDQEEQEVDVSILPDHSEFRQPPRKRLSQSAKNINVKRRRVDHDNLDDDDDNDDSEQYMTVTTTYHRKRKRREDILAETWAMKLKKMAAEQKLYAEKIINDVLYEGELGNLTSNGVSFYSSYS